MQHMQKRQIKLSPPFYDGHEEKAVLDVLCSGRLAQGERVREFEKKFAQFVGVRYAVAVNNGTSALIAALLALGIGSGDEVIVPALTFGATANSVLAVGARVNFADIDPMTFNINPAFVATKISKKTRAVIGVDLYGQCADWTQLKELARQHKLYLIEDAAQAHGASIGKKRAGSFADAATFSFYASKNMTTGEGGMVTTNNKKIFEKLLLLRNHGMKTRYKYDSLGFNFRMTDIGGALGTTQLKKLPIINSLRQRNARYLSKLLQGISGISLPNESQNFTHVFHEYVIRVAPPYSLTRDQLKKKLFMKGIETSIHYPYPLHIFPLYKQQTERFPNAEKAAREVLSLPVHPGLTKKELHYIASAVKAYAA